MFDIYSIGDSAFLAQILNAVAMICGTGDFVQLVSIGLIIGLIIICVQSIMGGVRELSLQHLLMGWIMYACFFGPSVTVTIEDAYTGQVRVVDNVPLGVGFSGSLISNIGYGVTVLFEQGYQNVATITNEPFAESLRELQAVRRNLDNPKVMQAINDTLAANSDVSRSLHNYLRECTMMKLANGAISLDELRTESWAEAIRFESQVFGTRLYLNGTQDLTCSAAWAPLSNALNQINAGAVIQEINRAIGVVDNNGQYPQHTDSIDAALNQLGNVSTDVQDFIKASIIEPIYQRAAQSYYTDYHDVAAATMVSQAINQRNTQWAAEQSMFMTTVRPILTFFEGFIYAITPLMGFLFVIGQFGIRLAMRYFQTVIWIQLWMPVMSICNLYIIMAARSEMASLGASRLDSFYALNRMDDLVSTWLATGGMLCTATPIIALFLVTGSTYAFTTLANRLGGGDHINEKVASPDALAVSAVHSQGAWQSGDSFGMQRTGSEGMFQTLDLGAMASANVSSARARMDQAANTLTDTIANNMSSGKTFQVNDQFATALSENLDASKSAALTSMHDSLYDFAKKHGATDAQAKQFASTETTRAALTGSGGFNLGKNKLTGSDEKLLADSGKSQGASLGLTGALGQDYSWMEKDSKTFTQDFAQLQTNLSKIGLSESDRAEFKESFANAIKNSHAEGYIQDMARSTNASLSEAAQNMLSASKSFQEAESLYENLGVRGSMKENEFANYAFAEATRTGNLGDFESAMGNYIAKMGSQEREMFNQRYDSLMKTGYSPMGDSSNMGMKAAALIGTLIRSGKYAEAGDLISEATGIQGRSDFSPYGNAGIATAHRASGSVNRHIDQISDDAFDTNSGHIRQTAEQGRGMLDAKNMQNRNEVSGMYQSNLSNAVLNEVLPQFTQWMNETDTSFMDGHLGGYTWRHLKGVAEEAGLTPAASQAFQSFGGEYKNQWTAAQIRHNRAEAREALYEENMRLYGNNNPDNAGLIEKLTNAQMHAFSEISKGQLDEMKGALVNVRGLSAFVTNKN